MKGGRGAGGEGVRASMNFILRIPVNYSLVMKVLNGRNKLTAIFTCLCMPRKKNIRGTVRGYEYPGYKGMHIRGINIRGTR